MIKVYAHNEAAQAESELNALFGQIATAEDAKALSAKLSDPVKDFISVRLHSYTFPYASNYLDYLALDFLKIRLNGGDTSLKAYTQENRVYYAELRGALSEVTGSISRRLAGYMRRGDIKNVPRFDQNLHVGL